MNESTVKTIALNDLHVGLGAKMVPFAGFLMPVRYSSDIEEHLTVRNGVGVFDVSHMGEFILEGPGALDLVQKVTSNDASKLIDGKVQYSCLPNATGGIVDDLLVYRFSEEKYYLVVNAGNIQKDWEWIKSHNTQSVSMKDVSSETSLLAVQGPLAIKSLQSLTSVDLKSMEYYSFKIGDFAGFQNIIISATGYTGSGGFEIYMPNDSAKAIWEAIFREGKSHGIKPIGLGARDTLRLEMGYCLYGNDINDETSPIEAGLGWITKFSKPFINSESLKKQKEEGTLHQLCAFAMVDKGIPRAHYELCDSEGNTVGEVTSGTMSPSLGIGIGLGYLPKKFTSTDTEIFVKVRGQHLKAKVISLPFYQSQNEQEITRYLSFSRPSSFIHAGWKNCSSCGYP